MERRKKILIAPLDWGLGHATRCIPVIKALLEQNYRVVVAGSGRSLALLKKEFPELTFYHLPSYNPVYPATSSMITAMALQLPRFAWAMFREYYEVQKIIRQETIDALISDNRYNCYSTSVKSVIITHQTNILMPAGWNSLQQVVNKINHRLLKRFNECWIPAPPDTPFSELMRVPEELTIRYIGYLSRFSTPQPQEKTYDLCVVCSGPEPQRTIFEKLVLKQLKEKSLKAIVVKGKPETLNPLFSKTETLTVANYMLQEELSETIQKSKTVMARSGYSTVMDLMRLNAHAVFVPTPGQTEQEYLAHVLKEQQKAYSTTQENFHLSDALQQAQKFPPLSEPASQPTNLLQQALHSLLQ